VGEGVLSAGLPAAGASRQPAAAYVAVAGALTCDGVPLASVAAAVGTPTYVYSAGTVRRSTAASTTHSRRCGIASTSA
jgi:diaminopimelate decarboxylase